MRISSHLLSLALALLLVPIPALASDFVELWQSSYSPGKPGYFRLKLDAASGWIDMTKVTALTAQPGMTRLKPPQVQEVFKTLDSMGIWKVEPLKVDKPPAGKFIHTGRITVRQGNRKRTITYQIDKEYIADDTKQVKRGIEPRTDLSKIDRYLSSLGIPVREPVNATPE